MVMFKLANSRSAFLLSALLVSAGVFPGCGSQNANASEPTNAAQSPQSQPPPADADAFSFSRDQERPTVVSSDRAGDPNRSASDPSAAPSSGVQVPRERWVTEMRGLLPAMFCQEGRFFRECFEINEAECFDQALRSSSACLEQTAPMLPPQLNQPEDGRHWGTVVGSCAGARFERELGARKRSDPRCQDPANWVN